MYTHCTSAIIIIIMIGENDNNNSVHNRTIENPTYTRQFAAKSVTVVTIFTFRDFGILAPTAGYKKCCLDCNRLCSFSVVFLILIIISVIIIIKIIIIRPSFTRLSARPHFTISSASAVCSKPDKSLSFFQTGFPVTPITISPSRLCVVAVPTNTEPIFDSSLEHVSGNDVKGVSEMLNEI